MREVLRARLRGQVPGVPIDWGWNAQGEVLPRVVLSVISGDTDQAHATGPTGYRRARVQIDCFAAGYAGAVALSRLVRAALAGWLSAPVVQGVFEIGERDTAPDTAGGDTLARVSIDYMIHFKEG